MSYRKVYKLKPGWVPFIYINGVGLPIPKEGMSYTVTTTVDSSRNVNAQVTGSKVGRDQIKLNDLEWAWLDASTWGKALREFEKFKCTVRYYDPVKEKWMTRYMYPGDRTFKIWKCDPTTGEPTEYIDCKCNLIDMGYGE